MLYKSRTEIANILFVLTALRPHAVFYLYCKDNNHYILRGVGMTGIRF